jgi:hypothetical protein
MNDTTEPILSREAALHAENLLLRTRLMVALGTLKALGVEPGSELPSPAEIERLTRAIVNRAATPAKGEARGA